MERLWICAFVGAPHLGLRAREFWMLALGHRALAWVHHQAQPHPRAPQASSACTSQHPLEMGCP